ncbi:MAG: hypothetical protein A3J27_07400 [Candidatus Tectomicrobia bacterium RIFCSPLOWO2_12_FULL_69_37]|nr:MAG: hypothetical protein A3I72_10210 [Candidatus Tectomicrobia bacterium RIFCSPLOWO2_02_FULL_70_19]OGL64276.1 MAG: hypothetical protein A3J27_07400 [Candidatus Tectomicrobia bacterium RIFCSPLOWO2_12_FULL_69_37]
MPRSIRLACALAAILALAPALPAPAPAQAPAAKPAEKSEETKKREEEERRARLAREAQGKEIQKKLGTMKGLIKEINAELGLRTAGAEAFERKRTLENQLRDYITQLFLTDQALTEAERLALEVEGMRKSTAAGPRDTQRLQLMNFLEARRREYVLFATR